MTTSFESIRKMKKEYDDKIRSEGRQILEQHFLEAFKKYPMVVGVKWTQYTPYFNDGEACEFSVHEPKLAIKDGDRFHYQYENKDIPDEAWSDFDLTDQEDVCLSVFGDHVKVTAELDEGAVSFEVSDYDHD